MLIYFYVHSPAWPEITCLEDWARSIRQWCFCSNISLSFNHRHYTAIKTIIITILMQEREILRYSDNDGET